MPKVKLEDFRTFEDKLQADGLDEAGLRKIVRDFGFAPAHSPKRIFPLGIVINDGVRASFDLEPAEIGPFVDGLKGDDFARIRSMRVFPLGTLAPDIFRVEVDVGRPMVANLKAK